MEFAEAMLARLDQAAREGRRGWRDKTDCTPEKLQGDFLAALTRANPNLVSVANYLMMLWHREETIDFLRLFNMWADASPKSSVSTEADDPNAVQIGGGHYLQYGDIQPWDVFMRWNLNPYCAYMLPYLVRYREKGGIEDLKKARHTLDKWISEEERIEREKQSQ